MSDTNATLVASKKQDNQTKEYRPKEYRLVYPGKEWTVIDDAGLLSLRPAFPDAPAFSSLGEITGFLDWQLGLKFIELVEQVDEGPMVVYWRVVGGASWEFDVVPLEQVERYRWNVFALNGPALQFMIKQQVGARLTWNNGRCV